LKKASIGFIKIWTLKISRPHSLSVSLLQIKLHHPRQPRHRQGPVGGCESWFIEVGPKGLIAISFDKLG
jgi:hypothetical protein